MRSFSKLTRMIMSPVLRARAHDPPRPHSIRIVCPPGDAWPNLRSAISAARSHAREPPAKLAGPSPATCGAHASRRTSMPQMTMVQAIQDALRTALRDNPDVVLLGEDIGKNGGVFRVTEGLQAEFGAERVFDTDRKSTRLNSSHTDIYRMPSSA